MKKVFILLIAVVVTSCMSSKQLYMFKGPKQINIDSVNVSQYLEKYKDYDAYYLVKSTIVEHSGWNELLLPVESMWDYSVIRSHRYILINPESEVYSVFKRANYKKNTIKKIALKVYSPDGTIKKYSRKDCKLNTIDGKETLSLAYPGLVKGCIIEETVHMQYSSFYAIPPLQEDHVLQYDVPVEKVSFTLAYPDWWKVKIKEISAVTKLGITKTQKKENNKIIIKYKAENVPATKSEPFSPYFKEFIKYINWYVTNLKMGQLRKIPLTSWNEVAKEIRKYAVDNDAFFSQRVKNTTKDLIENKKSPAEILDTVVTYIQKNIEINSSSKIKDFADVLKYKKGNPYFIAGLTKLMLFKAGIESDYLMVHPGYMGYFDNNIYEISQIPYPALKTTLDDEEYLILPYLKYLDYRAIPPFLLNQPALIVPKDYRDYAKIIRTPYKSLIQNSIVSNIEAEILDDGSITVVEERSFLGLPTFELRTELSKLDEDETNKFVEDLLGYDQGEIEIDEIEIENKEELKCPLIMKISYSLNNLVTITPEEVIFQTSGLFSPVNINKLKFDVEKRQNPIKISYDQTNLKQIVIKYPQHWKLQKEYESVEDSNKFGSVMVKYTSDKELLKIDIDRKLYTAEGEKDEIAELLYIYGNRSKLIVPDIIFDIE